MVYIKDYSHIQKYKYDEQEQKGTIQLDCQRMLGEIVNARIKKNQTFYKIDKEYINHAIYSFFENLSYRVVVTKDMLEDRQLLLDHLEELTATQFINFACILMNDYCNITFVEE